MGIYLFIVAGIISLGYGILDWIRVGDMYLLEMFDFVSGTLLLPLMVLLTCILVGYFARPKIILDEMNLKDPSILRYAMMVMVKVICPVCIALIFITQILALF